MLGLCIRSAHAPDNRAYVTRLTLCRDQAECLDQISPSWTSDLLISMDREQKVGGQKGREGSKEKRAA